MALGTKQAKSVIESLGFETLTDQRVPRLVISSEAPEKVGKTYLIGTMPRKMAVFSTDNGTRATLAQFAKQYPGEIIFRDVLDADDLKTEGASQAKCKEVFQGFQKDFKKIVESGEVRSVALDTASGIHSLVKMALFGRTTSIMAHDYGKIHDAFKNALAPLLYPQTPGAAQCNGLLIHRRKKVYVKVKKKSGEEDSSWDGKSYEVAGWKDIAYESDMHLQHYFDEDEKLFGIQCFRSRYNPAVMNGKTYWGKDCRFSSLAMDAWPETLEEDFDGIWGPMPY